MSTDSTPTRMAGSPSDVTHSLGLPVIAEGIESAQPALSLSAAA
jgi:EAL domain-containing protein (putative c-di-GMP-specific phosphodiesterase class I)